MIARRWTGLAGSSQQADAYVTHFERTVTPHLQSTDGFLGATLDRVERDDGIEIVVVTRWSSLEAIRAFAGEDIDVAVVEPEARAALSRFDTRVRHIELGDG
jgi:heme-degrading monooxygenase HmoA